MFGLRVIFEGGFGQVLMCNFVGFGWKRDREQERLAVLAHRMRDMRETDRRFFFKSRHTSAHISL